MNLSGSENRSQSIKKPFKTRASSQLLSKKALNKSLLEPTFIRTNFANPIVKKTRIFTYSQKTKSSDFSEKSTELTNKLNLFLSKDPKDSGFKTYTKIFNELCDFLEDFKPLLLALRKGLISSAFQGYLETDFEFKQDLDLRLSDFNQKIEKERKEKQALIEKLNFLNDETEQLRRDLDYLKSRYNNYKRIVETDCQKYIDANYLVEKMTNQCQIIADQQKYIKTLQNELFKNKSRFSKDLEFD